MNQKDRLIALVENWEQVCANLNTKVKQLREELNKQMGYIDHRDEYIDKQMEYIEWLEQFAPKAGEYNTSWEAYELAKGSEEE